MVVRLDPNAFDFNRVPALTMRTALSPQVGYNTVSAFVECTVPHEASLIIDWAIFNFRYVFIAQKSGLRFRRPLSVFRINALTGVAFILNELTPGD